MAYYCRHCGSMVTPLEEKGTYSCKCVEFPLHRGDVILAFIAESRRARVKAMHELVRLANDENFYMRWIYLVPDEPTNDDFLDIALDEELYADTIKLFKQLVAKENFF